MRRGLCSIAWIGAFVATTAGAHGMATTSVCGEARQRQVAQFHFTQAQLTDYEHCIKQQQSSCANVPLDGPGQATGGLTECRPQYCTEVALNLPTHSLNGPVYTTMSCGVVDDAWGRAAHMAADYCAAQSPTGSATSQVLSPATFLDPSYHHSLYSADQGLSGICVQCVEPTQ
ncbi:hypothetical protein [Dokdonella ginsengisoli]|uniref:Secreted protein n=1 Tax=Dokdonella ginsengisoli TaxID=363846 RepID=A0ABV9QSA2_9GAMM